VSSRPHLPENPARTRVFDSGEHSRTWGDGGFLTETGNADGKLDPNEPRSRSAQPKLTPAVRRALEILVDQANHAGARISNSTYGRDSAGHPYETGVYWQSAATLRRLGLAETRPGSGQHLQATAAGRAWLEQERRRRRQKGKRRR
jgi:hypothetical protein